MGLAEVKEAVWPHLTVNLVLFAAGIIILILSAVNTRYENPEAKCF